MLSHSFYEEFWVWHNWIFCRAEIKVLSGTGSPSEAQLGKDPLPSSHGYWFHSVSLKGPAWGLQFLVGCPPEVTYSSLPCGLLCRAAHSMVAYFKVSKRVRDCSKIGTVLYKRIMHMQINPLSFAIYIYIYIHLFICLFVLLFYQVSNSYFFSCWYIGISGHYLLLCPPHHKLTPNLLGLQSSESF